MYRYLAIVLLGFSGSGKDTIAYCFPPFRNYKFKQPACNILSSIYGVDYRLFNDRVARKEARPSALPFTNEEVPYTFDDIIKASVSLKPLLTNELYRESLEQYIGQHIIFTDVRYDQELRLIEELFGTHEDYEVKYIAVFNPLNPNPGKNDENVARYIIEKQPDCVVYTDIIHLYRQVCKLIA
jgi:hypothetical protein